jgi:hypothetical protein
MKNMASLVNIIGLGKVARLEDFRQSKWKILVWNWQQCP